MKANIYILFIVAAVILATSCSETAEYLPSPQPDEDSRYQTVPFSITVGITPMTDEIDDVELKTTFEEGDIIEITNSKILAEPIVLTSNGCEGKDKATFSGTLKVKLGQTLTSGSTTLTAALKNTDSTLQLYNGGRPFVNVKEIKSYEEGLDKYSYWACENFTYNGDATAIELEQKTAFVKFNGPFGGATFTMSLNNAFSSEFRIEDGILYAVPYGMVCNIMNFEQPLDIKGKNFYNINVTFPPSCVPGIFSVSKDKQVYFSRGCLQYSYDMYGEKWRLASNQYDTPYSDDQWISEFRWLDKWMGKGDTDAKDFKSFNCPLGPNWSVLSFEEWKYLLWNRPDAENKYGFSRVAGTKGVVLLPDDWALTDEFEISQNYSADEWSQMENAGAVFLPFEIDNFENYSTTLYWTSSAFDYDDICCLRIGARAGDVICGAFSWGSMGAVRLVHKREKYTPYNPVSPVTPITPPLDNDRCIVVDSDEQISSRFIIGSHGFYVGQHYEISMKVRVDYSTEFYEQPSVDNEAVLYCNLNSEEIIVGSEWTEVELSGNFGYTDYSVEFDLMGMVNKYYFDDISFKIDNVEVIANGDCSSDDARSFAVIEHGFPVSVTFLDNESIAPVEQKDIEPGTVIYEKDYSSGNGLVIEPGESGVLEGIETRKGKYYSIIMEARNDKGDKGDDDEFYIEMYGVHNCLHGDGLSLWFGAEWGHTHEWVARAFDDLCKIFYYNRSKTSKVYIRSLKVVYNGDKY